MMAAHMSGEVLVGRSSYLVEDKAIYKLTPRQSRPYAGNAHKLAPSPAKNSQTPTNSLANSPDYLERLVNRNAPAFAIQCELVILLVS